MHIQCYIMSITDECRNDINTCAMEPMAACEH